MKDAVAGFNGDEDELALLRYHKFAVLITEYIFY